jgi:hypothetical protein
VYPPDVCLSHMKKQLTAFVFILNLVSGSANANSDVPIKNRLHEMAIADQFCGDLGKSFAAFPWRAQLNGSTWEMWKSAVRR